jgi:hypothetical protein
VGERACRVRTALRADAGLLLCGIELTQTLGNPLREEGCDQEREETARGEQANGAPERAPLIGACLSDELCDVALHHGCRLPETTEELVTAEDIRACTPLAKQAVRDEGDLAIEIAV